MSKGRRSACLQGSTLIMGVLLTIAFTPLHAAAAAISMTSQHLTTTATCALVSYPKTAVVSTDTWVGQKAPTTNNGTQTTLTINAHTSDNDRIYLRFDLTQCLFAPPAGAIVRSATVRLFESALPPACNTFDIFRAPATWSETTVTWNNQPESTTIDQPPSSQETSASVTVGNVSTCATHTTSSYVSWDVQADVSAFLAGTATNFGWMIRDDTEDLSTGQKTTFAARELNTLADAPQLLITYSSV